MRDKFIQYSFRGLAPDHLAQHEASEQLRDGPHTSGGCALCAGGQKGSDNKTRSGAAFILTAYRLGNAAV